MASRNEELLKAIVDGEISDLEPQSREEAYLKAIAEMGVGGGSGGRGPKGDKGDTGEQGPQGEKGDQGDSGVFVGPIEDAAETDKVVIDEESIEEHTIPFVNDSEATYTDTYSSKKIQEMHDKLKNTKAEQTDFDVLKARTDTLSSLPEGATTNDAALADIAVGADGITYDTPADAVRSQFNDVNTLIGIKWSIGFVDKGGNIVDETASPRRVSNYIPCGSDVNITFKAETNHTNVSALTCYSADKTVLMTNVNIGDINKEYDITTPEGTIYVVLSTHNNYEKYIHFGYPANSSAIEGVVNEIKKESLKINKEKYTIGILSFAGNGSFDIDTAKKTLTFTTLPIVTISDKKFTPSGIVGKSYSYDVTAPEGLVSSVSKMFIFNLSTSDFEFKHISEYDGTYMGVCFTITDGFIDTDISNCSVSYNGYYTINGVNALENFVNESKMSAIEESSLNTSIMYAENATENANNIKPYRILESNVVTSGDTITIAKGGYYFVSYKIPSINRGILYLTFLDNSDNNYYIAACDDGTTSIMTNMITTISGNDGNKVGIIKTTDFVENKYFILRIDNRKGNENIVVSNIKVVNGFNPQSTKTVYVSTTGNDDNDGLVNTPLKTVNMALQNGANNILIMNGVYKQSIDLSLSQENIISISSYDSNGRVKFVDPSSVISKSETLVSGYTNVYSCATEQTFTAENIWIFQEGVNDATTLISDSERHPMQRGYAYRCHDTKITVCNATSLNDALTEIENDIAYKWFYDTETGLLYFSRPETITSNNPLCASFGNLLFTGANRSKTLHLSGIESKYFIFNVNETLNTIVSDCKSSNVYGVGAFRYNMCLNVTFNRCEAARCFSGTMGDGFNAHSFNTGEIYSKQTVATLIDCWSHDNCDDGYSDHERSEITIHGGLYEYNGKAGITPSFGSHCTCYNVYSRKNYSGFYYVGDTLEEEGGKFGQMVCYGCVAENNNNGGKKTGFMVTGVGNSAILVGCKSIGNQTGYVADTLTNTITLIDCGSFNDSYIKSGSGSFLIKNTNIVTE